LKKYALESILVELVSLKNSEVVYLCHSNITMTRLTTTSSKSTTVARYFALFILKLLVVLHEEEE